MPLTVTIAIILIAPAAALYLNRRLTPRGRHRIAAAAHHAAARPGPLVIIRGDTARALEALADAAKRLAAHGGRLS